MSPIAGSHAHDASTAVISAGRLPGRAWMPASGYAVRSATPQLSPIASSSRLITPPRPLIAISRPTAAKLSSASTKMALNR